MSVAGVGAKAECTLMGLSGRGEDTVEGSNTCDNGLARRDLDRCELASLTALRLRTTSAPSSFYSCLPQAEQHNVRARVREFECACHRKNYVCMLIAGIELWYRRKCCAECLATFSEVIG